MKKVAVFKRNSIVIALLAIAMFFLAAIGGTVDAANNEVTVQVTGEYGQTEARSMLAMVNDFRTGRYIDGKQDKVWARNQSGGIDTTSYINLGELQYDYELEKVAMQRAMEIALSFAHQRPNGDNCYSLFPDGYTSMGENIATGYGEGSNQTAGQTFESWCETNDSYNGQGHRRNMLGRSFNRIGVGHVAIHWSGRLTEGTRPYPYSTTIHFWVQEFGYRTDNYGLTQTSASDVSETREVELQPSKITKAGITKSKDSLTITYGDSYEFDDATSSIRYADTFPEVFNMTWTDGATSIGTYMLPVKGGYSLSSGNQNIANISGKTINAVNAGETTVTIVPEMAGAESTSINVTVEPASIKDADISISNPTYTGGALTPEPTVTLNGKTLVRNQDYEVSYSNNINAGNNTAKVTITGKGNYKDSTSKTFSIDAKTITPDMIDSIPSRTYTGVAHTPDVTVRNGSTTLVKNTDYTVEYSNNINAGTATATIKGKGNYKGTINKTFTISAKPLTDNMLTLSKTSFEYNGQNQKPVVTVKDGSKTLNENTDYTLTNVGGTNADTYNISVTGKGNYSGVISKNFTIIRKTITSDMIGSISSLTYNGAAQTPDVTVRNGGTTLKKGTDYTITCSNNTNAGTATATITGKENYMGAVEKSFTIKAKNIDASMVSADKTSFEYNGQSQKPAITVKDGSKTLSKDEDYTLFNGGGTDAGEYTFQVMGKGNYAGTYYTNYTITSKAITADMIDSISSLTYTGVAHTPDVTVRNGSTTLVKNTDYTVKYSKNTNVGTATATITGTGNYTGQESISFTINKKNLEDGDVETEEIPAQVFEGNEVNPTPVVEYNGKTLSAEDYDLSYTDNTSEGTGKVTVTGKGNFTGTRTLVFSIISKERADLKDFIATLEQDLNNEEDEEFKAAINEALQEAKSIAETKESTPTQLADALTNAQKARTAALAALQEKKDAEAQAKAEEEARNKAAARTTQKGADGTVLGAGASGEAVERAITTFDGDEGPSGSKFGLLQLRSSKQTNTSIKLVWTKPAGTAKIAIYGNACGKNNKMRRLTTSTGTSYNVTKISANLKKGTYHKFMVVALDKNNNVISSSKVIHVATKGNKKYGNPTKVTVKKPKTLKRGKTHKLKGKQVGKKVKKHRAVAYETSNPKVATVNGKGVVKAMGKGTCYVYAYAQNGVFKKVKIKVK